MYGASSLHRFKKVMEEKLYRYQDYLVSERGVIYDLLGNRKLIGKGGWVTIYIDGVKYRKQGSRIVYEAVSGKTLTRKEKVQPIDGDPCNIAFTNLELSRMKACRRKKFTAEQEERIRTEYNREERKEHDFKGEYAMPSYNELCQKYDCSRSTIYTILTDRCRGTV